MNDIQEKIWDCLCGLDGETVANLFTDYYGTQLLAYDFADFLVDEGYLEEEHEESDDDEW